MFSWDWLKGEISQFCIYQNSSIRSNPRPFKLFHKQFICLYIIHLFIYYKTLRALCAHFYLKFKLLLFLWASNNLYNNIKQQQKKFANISFNFNNVNFQHFSEIKFFWRQRFLILSIHKPILGSFEVPHKVRAQSV